MGKWLVKEEPTHYAYADLAKDGGTDWSGVHNPLALRHLRSMRSGEEVLYYHTGSVKAVVGIARVAGTPELDPDDDRGSYRVRITPTRALRAPVTLATIKADPAFRTFDLVRNSRLSVMPVPAPLWSRILRYEAPAASSASTSRAGIRRSRPGPRSGSA